MLGGKHLTLRCLVFSHRQKLCRGPDGIDILPSGVLSALLSKYRCRGTARSIHRWIDFHRHRRREPRRSSKVCRSVLAGPAGDRLSGHELRARVQRQRAATSNAVIARTTSNPGGDTTAARPLRGSARGSPRSAAVHWRCCADAGDARWRRADRSAARDRPGRSRAGRSPSPPSRRSVRRRASSASGRGRRTASGRSRRPAAGARVLEQPGLLAARAARSVRARIGIGRSTEPPAWRLTVLKPGSRQEHRDQSQH